MSDGETPPPRPTRPLNYVVTEFLDASGPPKMPPRPNNGLMPADPPKRGPPPIPSYRQHVEARDEPMYVEVSPSKDSDSGDRTLTNNQSNMTPPPVTHYDTPVAPPRRKTFSGSIPRSPETSASTARDVRDIESKQPQGNPSRPHGPLHPQRSTPPTPVNTPTKATPPRQSGTVRPKSQVFQRDPPPPPRASTLSSGRSNSHHEERQGNVFSNLFKRRTTKKPYKPVITVVDTRPIDSETTPSPVKTPPTSLPPAQSYNDRKSPPSETAMKPDRAARMPPSPSRPPPSSNEPATGAEDSNKPNLPAGTQAKEGTPTVAPRTQTSPHSTKPSAVGENVASEMAGERQPELPNQAAAAGEQGVQSSPVPKPRTRTLVKKPPALSDAPQEAHGEVVAAAAKEEIEKDGTQQPAKPRPPPPSLPRASTLDAKQTSGAMVKLEGPINKAVAPAPTSDDVGTIGSSTQAGNAPLQSAQKRGQPDKSETPTRAPPKPNPPSRPRPPAPARQLTKEVVEAPLTPGEEGTTSVDTSECAAEVDALYSVPQKPAKKADPAMVVEELKNTQPDVAAAEKAPCQESPKGEDSPKVSSPKKTAPPKPAPPNRAKAPTPTSPLTKAVGETRKEVPTAKEESDAVSDNKASGLKSDMLVVASPPDEQKADLSEDKEVENPASAGSKGSEGNVEQPSKGAEAAVKEPPKKQPPKPKPPPPSRPRPPTLEKKQTGGVRTGSTSSGKKASQLDALELQAGEREAEDKGGVAALKAEKAGTSAEAAGVEIAEVAPSNPAPLTLEDGEGTTSGDASQCAAEVDALYSVPQKPAKKADPAMVVEGLKNTQPDVAAVEKAPCQESPKGEDSPKVSSPKKTAPPKPAPPNRAKAPTPTSPLVKGVGETKQKVPVIKKESEAGSEKKATGTQTDMIMTVLPPEAPIPESSEDKSERSPVSVGSEGSVEQPSKSAEAAVKEPPKKQPPKPRPPPPSRPRLPTLGKKQEGRVSAEDSSNGKEASQLERAELQAVKQEADDKGGDAALKVEKPGTSAETAAAGPAKDPPYKLEAPKPDVSEDKNVKKSINAGNEDTAAQPGKREDTTQGTPKKAPPKPPPPSRPRLPMMEKKQEVGVRAEESSISSKDTAVPQDGEEKAEDKTGVATPKEEKRNASAETMTMETPKTDVSSMDDSSKEGQVQDASANEVGTARPGDEMTDQPKDVTSVEKAPRQESPKVEDSPKVSSPKRTVPPKPAPPNRAKAPTPTSSLMKAFVEARQEVSTVSEDGDAGSERKTAEQNSEMNKSTPSTQRDEADVASRSIVEQQPEVSSTSLGGDDKQSGNSAHVEVTPVAQAKKKAPPKPAPPSKPKRPAPARPPMKVAKASEPPKSVQTSDGSSEVASPLSQQEALPTSEAASPPLAMKPENIRKSQPDTAACPSSKKSPPPKPGPPNKPKPPAPAKVEAAPGEQQQQEPAQDAGSVDSITVPLEDTVPTLLASASGVDGEVATRSEPAERNTKTEVDTSSHSTSLTAEDGRAGRGNEEAGEPPQSPGPSDVITTPTNPSSGNGGGGKPAKPTPPSGSRPPPPSGDKRKPPPPKRPPPAKGPPPPKPKQPGPLRHHGNAPPPLPPRPMLGHILYHYVTSEPRAVAKYNFTAQLPGELSFDEGDVLEILSREDVDWLICRNVTDHFTLPEGLVHQRHVKIIKKLPGETQSFGEGGPCAVAMSEFRAESFEELSLKNGDLVYLDSRVDLHWLRGHLQNGTSGIFPKDVVEIVEDLPVGPMECEVQQHPTPSGPHCVAEFFFEAEGPGELSLCKGDVVELLERVGGDWLRGRLAGKEGIFPTNFVKIIKDLPPGRGAGSGMDTPTLGPNMATAVADFEGMDGELSFKVGEHITVTGRVDEDWLEGSLQGQTGIFPATFIDHVPSGLSQVGKEGVGSPTVQQSGVDSKPTKTGKCKALHKFETDIDGELPLNRGDIIVTTAWINDEWLSGRLGNKEGIFPISFVEVLEELPRSSAEVSKHHHKVALGDDLMPKGKVLYDFTPATDEEIPLKAGEAVLLLEKVDQAWYNGENSAGNIGNFPTDYIQVVVPLP